MAIKPFTRKLISKRWSKKALPKTAANAGARKGFARALKTFKKGDKAGGQQFMSPKAFQR